MTEEMCGEPVKVLASKTLATKSQLTKCDLEGIVFYVRENTLGGEQVLEICAPEAAFERIWKVVWIEDSLKRKIIKNSGFTAEWAEKELSDGTQTQG